MSYESANSKNMVGSIPHEYCSFFLADTTHQVMCIFCFKCKPELVLSSLAPTHALSPSMRNASWSEFTGTSSSEIGPVPSSSARMQYKHACRHMPNDQGILLLPQQELEYSRKDNKYSRKDNNRRRGVIH